MRFCDLLRHFKGDFVFKLYYVDGKMFREETLINLDDECTKSFNVLTGFNCELWEMKVRRWGVSNNIVNVELYK